MQEHYDDTLSLYSEILKGVQMGIDSIDEMLGSTKDEKFKSDLIRTQEEYKDIARRADSAIVENGGTPRELPAWTRLSTWGMVKMKAAVDDTPENMSEMILKGMDMADKSMAEATEKYQDANEEACRLAGRLLEIQNAHRVIYKKYLS